MSNINEVVRLMYEAFDDNLDFSFPINGSSMQPFLYKDDIVRLRKCHMAYPGDIVFYKHGDNYILHRVVRVNKDGSYNIVGDHQTKCDLNVDSSMIIGVVVAYKKRNQKKYNPLKGIRYFIYHHLVRLKLVRFLNSKLFKEQFLWD